MPTMLSPLNLTQQELQNAVVQNLAAAPGTPKKGQLYFNASTNTLYWNSDGTTNGWVAATGSGAVTFGSPVASAVGDAAADGASTSAARADHKHAREAFASPTAQTTYGQASSAGTATTLVRSDHTHGTPPMPTSSQVGAVANGGNVPTVSSGVTGSRPAAGTIGALYLDTTTFLLYRDNGTTWDNVARLTSIPATSSALNAVGAAGTSTDYARADHAHQGLAAGMPIASAVGDVAAAGSAGTVARSDHTHARESFGNITTQTTFGLTGGNGVATTLARADHTHGTPTHDDTAHNGIHLNALAQPTAAVNFGGQRATNAADPTGATDLVTKQYADNMRAGLSVKDPVRVASTANVAVATGLVAGQVIDGITLVAGDRVLLKNQTTASENGVYLAVASGSGTRATDADGSGELVDGTAVWVQAGTANANTRWVVTAISATPWVPGTTTTAWTMDFAATTTTAGAGLVVSGSGLAVGAGPGIVVNADTVQVDRSTNGATVPLKYSQTIGDGAATSIVVTHNLGTQDVHVALYAVGTPFGEVIPDIQHTSTNTVTLVFGAAPAANAYRVVVIG